MKRFLLFAIVSTLIFSCSKDKGSNNNTTTKKEKPKIPVIENGTAYLQFEDSSETTWYAQSLNREINGNTLTLYATGDKNSVFELQTVDLLGDDKVPVGGSVGYLKFTNKDGEQFSTEISGAGDVFYSRFDQERIEATFLFPIVGSIKNNFMELTNGKFGFNLPVNVSLSANKINPDQWSNYLFVEIPIKNMTGNVVYNSGPKTGYSIEVTSTDNVVDPSSVQFSGEAGSNFSYKVDFSGITSKKDIFVDISLKYGDSLLQTFKDAVNILPIYGTYKLQAMGGAPSSSAILTIEAITSPSNQFYKASSSFFGKTLLFEDDGTGDVECYDTFQYRGETCTNIYFYDNGPNEIHMAVHTATYHDYYVLIRQ